MKIDKDSASSGDEEIATLIESFHAIGQRLEELTESEVDTVTDRRGRTFLMRLRSSSRCR